MWPPPQWFFSPEKVYFWDFVNEMCWQQSSSNRRAQERCVVPVRWGVQLPSVCMHSNDYFGADAEPIAAHGISELLARSKAQPSSNTSCISNPVSMHSCWRKSSSVGGPLFYWVSGSDHGKGSIDSLAVALISEQLTQLTSTPRVNPYRATVAQSERDAKMLDR